MWWWLRSLSDELFEFVFKYLAYEIIYVNFNKLQKPGYFLFLWKEYVLFLLLRSLFSSYEYSSVFLEVEQKGKWSLQKIKA